MYATNEIRTRDVKIDFLQRQLLDPGIHPSATLEGSDVEMDNTETELTTQMLCIQSENADLQAANKYFASASFGCTKNSRATNANGSSESFRDTFQALDSATNEKISALMLQQSQLEKTVNEKTDAVMALRSSVAAIMISLARNKQQSGSRHIKLSVIRNVAAVPSAAVVPPPIASPVEETPMPVTATIAPPAVPVQATMVSVTAVPPAAAPPPVAPMDVTSAFVQAMQNDDWAPKYGKPYQQVLRKFKDEVSHADELQLQVRSFWRFVYGVDKISDFVTYKPVDPDRGWTRSHWNIVITQNLLKKLKAKSDERQEWNLPSVPDDYISTLLWESQHQYETLNEVAFQVGDMEDKEYNNKRIRQGQARNFTETATILDLLGVHGMSPEESGVHTIDNKLRRIFIIRLYVWRSVEVTEYLKIIDNEDTNMRSSSQGPDVHPRIPIAEAVSYPAPRGLPRALYSKEWLEKLSKHRIDELRISKEAFDILSLVVEGGHL
ncbi:hypothetical protein EV421DRAFT_1743089 [Armillaria borealis]|uniref:Uncharacterized protein n=1 Tax=Armillaria borealis TaxID=47425 RepID=A0AA39IXN8_9AGAR|nr:hypothetical protein EV421DRAFT_1743089 [Armillaria borealis]